MFGIGILTAIFVVVLIVSWRVLPDMGFEGISRGGLAICVAALGVMGLGRFVSDSPKGPADPASGHFGGLLLPYEALGVSLLLLPLALLVTRCLDRMKKYGLPKKNSYDEVTHSTSVVHQGSTSIPRPPTTQEDNRLSPDNSRVSKGEPRTPGSKER